MHGHNWKVEVEVCGNKLDNIGMVKDFKEIRKMTKKVSVFYQANPKTFQGKLWRTRYPVTERSVYKPDQPVNKSAPKRRL